MIKNELKTYQDLVDFLNKLQSEIIRLNSNTNNTSLNQFKTKLLCEISTQFHKSFVERHEVGLAHSLVINNDIKYKEYFFLKNNKSTTQLNSKTFSECIQNIEQQAMSYGPTYLKKEETGAQFINRTLDTHQHWFKWLLSFLFDAPKSKQFLDGFSIFDRSIAITTDDNNQSEPAATI